jgi:hypothetical protein
MTVIRADEMASLVQIRAAPLLPRG